MSTPVLFPKCYISIGEYMGGYAITTSLAFVGKTDRRLNDIGIEQVIDE